MTSGAMAVLFSMRDVAAGEEKMTTAIQWKVGTNWEDPAFVFS